MPIWRKELPREKNYKPFIGYLYNDDKVKPLHLMLPTTSAYVKSNDGQTECMWCIFWLKMTTYEKNITLFVIW